MSASATQGGHNQTPVVVDLLISGLPLVNRDVMQLNVVTGQLQPESG